MPLETPTTKNERLPQTTSRSSLVYVRTRGLSVFSLSLPLKMWIRTGVRDLDRKSLEGNVLGSPSRGHA